VAVLTFHDGHPEAEGRCLSTKVFGRDGRLLLDDGEGAPRVLASAKHGRIVLLPGRCREILEYQYEGTIRILDGRGKQLAEFLFFPSGRNPLFWRPGASFETVIDGSGRYFVWVAGDALCVVDLVGLRVARQRPFCQDPGFHQDWILDGIDTSGALLEMRYRSRMDQKKHQRFFLDPEKMFNRLPAVSEGCRRQAVSRDLVALFQ
jgi:hypothetical protein